MSAARPWRPLVTGEERATIVALIAELVAASEAHPPSTLDALCDRALVRTYLAQDDTVPDPEDTASAALEEALRALGAATPLALFDGVAGLGWCVAHVAGGEAADAVAATLDTLLSRALAEGVPDFDLAAGVTGIGVYALERGAQGHALARQVLDDLERRAVERGDGLAWFTAPTLLTPEQRAVAPEGFWNLGLAHGTPGVIALLARYVERGLERARARRLLDGAVAFVHGAAPPRAAGRFPAWIGHGARPLAPTSLLAWCYGDLGVACALFAAAHACGVEAWRTEALALAHACAARPVADACVRDAALCHGVFGAMHLFGRLFHATGDAAFDEARRRWLAEGLALRAGVSPADPSLLGGTGGIALALHALISEEEPAWDRRLLVDLAPPP